MLTDKNFMMQIRPEVKGRSDKFSINLYRFLLKYKDWPVTIHTFPFNRWDHAEFPVDWMNPKMGQFMLCHRVDNSYFVSGKFLSEILLGGPNYKQMFAYPLKKEMREKMLNCTDRFKTDYLKYGRGFWDRQANLSMVDDECRWEYIDENTRRCLWTGTIKHRKMVTTQIERTREVWR